ncbi:MAG: response regulator transcription factor [Candidatus Promineifilaceae bacterium]
MIRVVLAHPSHLVCDSLRAALDREEGVYLVGSATTKEELYFLIPHGNLVLLSTELENEDTLHLLQHIRKNFPAVKVLVLGISEQPGIILKYIEAGATGYILQDESIEEMIAKLQAASEEKALVSPSVAAVMMERLTHLANLETPLAYIEARDVLIDELTSREEEVLGLVAEGCTNKEIANKLIIECGTVKNHVHNILKKLEVNSRHEAASIFQMQNRQAVEGVGSYAA